jgi:phosphoribosylformylglycinamidine synthase
MCFAGGVGAHVDLRKLPLSSDLAQEGRADKVLFSESNGRFLVEVSPRARRGFLAAFAGLPLAALGQVREAPRLQAVGLDGKTLSWSVSDLEKAWRGGGVS